MSIKTLLIVMILLKLLYSTLLNYISYKHDQKKLPEEVAHIYDKERYETYLSYKKEYRKTSIFEAFLHLLTDIFIIYSPYYYWIEAFAGNNVYLICIVTILFTSLIGDLISIPFSYYETFYIEEKYGMNKKDFKEFIKDTIIDMILNFVGLTILISFIIFISEFLGKHVDFAHMTYLTSFMIMFIIFILFFAVVFFIQLLSLVMMKMQYKFTDLPDGELKDEILNLTKGCKKKIKRIMVYNESSKSNSKNAFLLKLPGYRIFGIADNFLEENSQRQLLAVLAHEVGHLKYKKGMLNYLQYLISFLFFLFFVWLLPNIHVLLLCVDNIHASFNLTYLNYYLIIQCISVFVIPIVSLVSIFSNYVTRKEEYLADLNSVKCGYGLELIETFQKLSSDELINVNPSPIIEFLEYDHPGMYNRIKAIHQGIDKYSPK